jgi:hypothetical protein
MKSFDLATSGANSGFHDGDTLTPPYSMRILTPDNVEWSRTLDLLSDANIYQTWAFEAARQPANQIAYAVLTKGDEVVGAAMVRVLFEIPRLFGVAYLYGGPLWRRYHQNEDPAVLREMLRGLRREFVRKRRLVLRIQPRILDDASGAVCRRLLEEERFIRNQPVPCKRTLLVDLAPPLDKLRAGLESKWRGHLNRAERAGLVLVEGSAEDLLASFVPLYRELLERKGLELPNDFGQFVRMQSLLPEHQKLRVILAQKDGTTCAASVGVAVGDTGLTLFRAASAAGMELNAPHLVHWRLLEWIKSQGCRWYDLGGISPESNPGTYKYKRGLCGRNGTDVQYIGTYESFPTSAHRLLFRECERSLRWMRDIWLRRRWASAVQLPAHGNATDH